MVYFYMEYVISIYYTKIWKKDFFISFKVCHTGFITKVKHNLRKIIQQKCQLILNSREDYTNHSVLLSIAKQVLCRLVCIYCINRMQLNNIHYNQSHVTKNWWISFCCDYDVKTTHTTCTTTSQSIIFCANLLCVVWKINESPTFQIPSRTCLPTSPCVS